MRSFEAVEFATLEWVDWFNNRLLLEPIGNLPPAEAEAIYYAQLVLTLHCCVGLKQRASGKPGAVQFAVSIRNASFSMFQQFSYSSTRYSAIGSRSENMAWSG